jgi:MazG family protein
MKQSDGSCERLQRLVRRLRGPDGCPWDRDQTLIDLRAYLLEEAHEVAAAIDSGDWDDLCGELGDLLFHLIFVACLAEETDAFDLHAVVDRIEAKMIARHPHVFGSEVLADADAVHREWERRKLETEKAGGSLLAGLPASLPALVAALRMTQKAAAVGFDWPDAAAILAKLSEELAELNQELKSGEGSAAKLAISAELGDVLFTVANLARHLDIDPEAALAAANKKFRQRFQRLEQRLAERGKPLGEATLAEMEVLWQQIKDKGETG